MIAEQKAKQAVNSITNSLRFEINFEEDNYDAGYAHALHNHGEALYMMGFSEGQSNPKIKQLEWRYDEEFFIWEANSVFGKYSFVDNSLIVNKKLFFRGREIAIVLIIDEAKAAAQADFEKRIKECLITE